MDLDEWYDLVEEPLPQTPPPRDVWPLVTGILGAVVAVVAVGAVFFMRDDGDDQAANDRLETTDTTAATTTSTTDASTTTTSRRETPTTTTARRSTTTTIAAPIAPPVTSPPTTAAPPPPTAPPPTAAPTTTAPPPPPPPPASQPGSASAGNMTASAVLSPLQASPGGGVTSTVHYTDERGNLDLIRIEWGDGTAASERDVTPTCAVPGAPPAGREDRTYSFGHTYGSAGSYVVRVLVMTDDCTGGRDRVALTGRVNVF